MEYRDSPEGSESKLNTIPDGIKVLRTIVKLYRSYIPLRFFGIIAAILAALSVIFFYSRVGWTTFGPGWSHGSPR